MVRAQEKEKTQLRGAMDELLSELTFVAAKSCEQLVDERRRVEQLIKKLRENKIINMPSEEFLSDTGQFGQAIDTKTILRAHSQNEPSGVSSKLWNQVVTLDKQGKSSTEIAKELDMGQGEVQLVLNLARQ